MRRVGRRTERPLSFSASGELLKEGARFNEEIHRLPTGNKTFTPKGVYFFKTHEEANQFDLKCVVDGIAKARRKP